MGERLNAMHAAPSPPCMQPSPPRTRSPTGSHLEDVVRLAAAVAQRARLAAPHRRAHQGPICKLVQRATTSALAGVRKAARLPVVGLAVGAAEHLEDVGHEDVRAEERGVERGGVTGLPVLLRLGRAGARCWRAGILLVLLSLALLIHCSSARAML
jgi:hypothetical protein